MLAAALPYQTQLTALAEAWLMAGAATFSLWQRGQLLAHWPVGVYREEGGLTALIWVGGNVWGELRVTGCDQAVAQARLAIEASLISRLVELEVELAGIQPEVRVALELTRLDRVFSIYADVDAAIVGPL